MIRLCLTADTVGPVSRGHPWVYPDGVEAVPEAGTPVQLIDGSGRPVAFGLADAGAIAVRVLGRHPSPLPTLLAERVQMAATLRARVVPENTDAYRLLNGAGDRLPGLVVDRYGDLLVLRVYARCWEPHLDSVLDALALAYPGKAIARRLGVRAVDGSEGLVPLRGSPPPEKLIVQEAGVRFLVRPAIGQKTGLFLDQREHRRFVAGLAADLNVANLFGYTGGFSVHAAAAGAKRVITVDISEDALNDAKENFRLNGMNPDTHGFDATDAFKWAPPSGTPIDLLISDPPNLSHGKKADRHAQVAYRDLATRTGRMLRPGGLLATASCTARLDRTRWEQAVREGLRKAGRWSWLWRADEPPDHPVGMEHPEGRYLKFAVLHRH